MNESNSTSGCRSCPAGWYQKLKGATECVECDAGKYNEETGANAESMCKKCTEYAEHTTTAGKMGVSDPESGCICVGADTSAADGTDARSGYYTNPNALTRNS